MDASDYQIIRQLFDDYLRMYSSRDDRLTTYFSEDFSGITGSGDFLVKDRDEWIAITRQDFAQVKDPIRIELKDLAIQSLAEMIAVATSTFTIHLPIKDHVLSRKTARLVLIFRKESAGWKISHNSISVSFGTAQDGEVYPLMELEERNQYLEEQITQRTMQLSEVNDTLQRTNEKLAREIDEHKQAEKALKESEFFFKESQRSAAIGSYKCDFLSGYWESSEVLDTIFGIDKSYNRSIQGWLDIVHPDDREILDQYLREEVISGRKLFAKEYRIIRKNDGETRWVNGLGEVQFNSNGNIISLIGTIQDISGRKLAEKALLESEFRWKFAIEGSGDGIWDWNIQTDEAKYSKRWKEMLGYAEDDILSTNQEWIDRIHPDDQSYVAGAMQAYLDGKTSIYLVESRLRCKDESYKWILGRGTVVSRSKDGKPLRMIGTHTDITDRKEHEKEQLKIEKLESLGVLAGGIAHDFNNILTGIMGNISFAQMFLDTTHKSYRPLVEAEKASVRATELAHQLLTFARGGEPVKKVVSVQQLVNETVSLVLHGSNVIGIVDILDSIHAIKADEGQMSQVFHNIVINATQAMPIGGTLTVTAQNETLRDDNTVSLPPGTYIRLTFTDHGCGISDDDLKRIFDPYFTTKSAGNGLGLASVHSIVNRHGGHIGASSVVGEGTTVTIHLPSIGETYSKYQTDYVTQTTGDHIGGSILVMDDDEMIRDMTTNMLEYLGYQVTTCENGAEAIMQYNASLESGAPFSAVIMDLTIPGGMGGKETAQQILASDPQACLIVSSGYSNDPIMADYSTYGFNGAMAKPYNIKTLEQLLSSLLSAR